MSDVVFILLIVLLAAEAVWAAYICVKSTQKRHLFLIFPLIVNFGVGLLPAVAALASGDVTPYVFGYTLEVWNRGLLLDLVFCGVFIFVVQHGFFTVQANRFAERLATDRYASQFLLVLFIAAMIGYVALSGEWSGTGYEAVGDYVKTDLTSTSIAVGGIQRTIFRAILIPLLWIFLFFFRRRKFSWALRLLACGGLGYMLWTALASGVRGQILDLFLGGGACFLMVGKKRKAVTLFVIGPLLLLLLTPTLKSYRGYAKQYAGLSDEYRFQFLISDFNDNRTSLLDLQELGPRYLSRLDDVQDGGILAYRTDESGHFVYFAPFIGSLLSPIPRYFWPAKPLPLSGDNTVAGIPAYLVMAYRNESQNNGGVTASAIAYWEGGYFGVVLTAFVCGCLFNLLTTAAVRGGTTGIFLLLVMLQLNHYFFTISLDTIILNIMQLILPLLLLYKGFKFTCNVVANRAPRPVTIRPGPVRKRPMWIGT